MQSIVMTNERRLTPVIAVMAGRADLVTTETACSVIYGWMIVYTICTQPVVSPVVQPV